MKLLPWSDSNDEEKTCDHEFEPVDGELDPTPPNGKYVVSPRQLTFRVEGGEEKLVYEVWVPVDAKCIHCGEETEIAKQVEYEFNPDKRVTGRQHRNV